MKHLLDEHNVMDSPEDSGKSLASLLRKARPSSSTADRKQDPNVSLASDTDDELDFSDSEDEKTPRVSNPVENYWNALGESLKKIHDDSDSFLIRPKPNFKSSGAFKDVMTDIYGNSEYGKSKGYTKLKEKVNRLTNISGLASRVFARAAQSKEEEPVKEEEHISDSEEPKVDIKELTSALGGAKRGWKMVKRHVNESVMEKKTEKTKLNWDMVSHHVKGMTDLERARHDLYERYGLLPALQKDGTFECRNSMWSERAIRLNLTNPAQYNILPRDNRRARSANPRIRKASPKVTVRPQSEKPRLSVSKTRATSAVVTSDRSYSLGNIKKTVPINKSLLHV